MPQTDPKEAHDGEGAARSRAGRWLLPLTLLLGLTLLVVAIYSNSFSVPFLYDDKQNIVDNAVIKQLSNLSDLSGSRYVGFLTLALNYYFDRLHPFGYHLVNLLIHLINGGLVFLLVQLLFHTPRLATGSAPASTTSPTVSPTVSWIALTTTALFLVHPIQTEAVTYIVQRFASLAALFYLLTVVCYLRWRVSPASRRRWLWYGAALLTTVLAMKTKENTFTLPFMLLLVELVFFGLPSRRGWLGLLPFFLTLPIIPLSRPGAIGEGEAGFASETTSINRPDYLFTQFRVIVTYLRLLVLPIQQNLDYDYPVYHSLFQLPVFVSFLALLGLGGTALWLLLQPGPVLSARAARSLIRGERPDSPRAPHGHTLFPPSASRLAAFGVLWFFLTLSIESSIIPIRDVIYEHRLYLPCVGLFLAASALLFGAPVSRRLRNVAAVAVGLVVLVLAIATYERNMIWQSEQSLWQDVVRKSPKKARGYNNLGLAFKMMGRDNDAIRAYRTAIALIPEPEGTHHDPGRAGSDRESGNEASQGSATAMTNNPALADAHNNLGLAYKEMGRDGDAIREYQTAINLNPDLAEAHNNLGLAYSEQGALDEAIREFQTAVKLNPYHAENHNNLGIVYTQLGHSGQPGYLEKAMHEFETASRFNPDFAEPYYNLGNLYRELGRLNTAIEYYRSALQRNPNYALAWNNLGLGYYVQGKLPEALDALKNTTRLQPDYIQAHNNLGVIYNASGQPQNALRAFQTAITLKPDYVDAYYNLGTTYASMGQIPQATRAFERVLQIRPDDARARRALTALGR